MKSSQEFESGPTLQSEPNSRILLAFSDPGGAQECAAIAQHLASRNFVFRALTDSSGWIPPALESITERVTISEIRDRIAKWKTDRVVIGTSVVSEIELRVLEAAQALDIPTAALIDHWTNYLERFRRPSISIFPSVIFVNDESARSEAISEGLDAEKIRILANPHFVTPRAFPLEPKIESLRKPLGFSPDSPVILFLSDALTESAGGEKPSQLRFGFTEFQVLKDLIDALQWLDPKNEWQLLIKLHPRENPEKFNSLLENSTRTSRIIQNEVPLVDAFRMADRWVGMFTAALIELNGYGCVPIRYEPNATKNLLPAELRIFSRVTNPAEWTSELKRYLGEPSQSVRFDPQDRATNYSSLLEFLA